jgi:hypothetical protein
MQRPALLAFQRAQSRHYATETDPRVRYPKGDERHYDSDPESGVRYPEEHKFPVWPL